MKYSERLGEISEEQLQKALNKFNLGKFIKAEPIAFGNFGQNLFLTSDKGKFVFRGKPHYPWQFEDEKFMADLLHAKTHTPVSWPYLIDKDTDIFGWSYCIMPRLSGLQLKDKSVYKGLSFGDKLEIARALGDNLAEMQKLTWSFCGKYDSETTAIKPLDKPWELWVAGLIGELTTKCMTYNEKITKADKEWIEEMIEQGKESLKIPFSPTFVMHDYQISNMVVDRVNGRWRVTGLFDLMESYFGDGETDLSRTFAGYAEESEDLAYGFLNSYLAKAPARPGFEKRWPVYMIMDRMVVWEWIQRNGKGWWKSGLTFKDWVNILIRLVPEKSSNIVD